MWFAIYLFIVQYLENWYGVHYYCMVLCVYTPCIKRTFTTYRKWVFAGKLERTQSFRGYKNRFFLNLLVHKLYEVYVCHKERVHSIIPFSMYISYRCRYVYPSIYIEHYPMKGAYIPFVMLYDNNRFIFRKCDNNFIWIYCSVGFPPLQKILFRIENIMAGNLNRFSFQIRCNDYCYKRREASVLP